MSAILVCPGCKKRVKVPDKLLGRQVSCPTCGTGFAAASEEEISQVVAAHEPPPVRQKRADEKFCHECGVPIRAKAVICPKCGVQQSGGDFLAPVEEEQAVSTNRVAAGVFAMLLGALGIHKFILGMPLAGIIMLLVTVLTCGWGGIVMGLISLVEGILYLSKSDREFYRAYVIGKRSWF